MSKLHIVLTATMALSLAALSACGGAAGDPGVSTANDVERVRVIVEFAVPTAQGAVERDDQAALEDARKAFEAAVREMLDEKSQASMRSFRLLPIISLEADGETLTRLLQMPEVVSIEPDREADLLSPQILDKK